MPAMTGRHAVYVNAEEAAALMELIAADAGNENRTAEWHPHLVEPTYNQLYHVTKLLVPDEVEESANG